MENVIFRITDPVKPNGEAGAAIADTLMEAVGYKVVTSNHCPFCGNETCTCEPFKACSRDKKECESCSG